MAIKDNRSDKNQAPTPIPMVVIPDVSLIPGVEELDPNDIGDPLNPPIIDPNDPDSLNDPPAEDPTEDPDPQGKEEDPEPDPIPDPDPDPKEDPKDEAPINFQGVVTHFDQEGALDIEGFKTETDPTDPAYMQEAVEHTVAKKLEAYKAKFENPVSKKFIDFLEAGGDPSKFIETYSKRNYKELTSTLISENETLQEALVEEDMKADGDDPETIKEMIETLKDRGVLEKYALRAQRRGEKRQITEEENLLKAQQDKEAQAAKAREQIVQQLTEDVTSRNNIGGFKLTEKSKQQFIDYIVTPDKKTGMTQLQKDSQDPEKQILMAYLYHINFDFDALSKEVQTNVTSKLKENLGRFTDDRDKGKGTTRPKAPSKTSSVDQDVLKGWLNS